MKRKPYRYILYLYLRAALVIVRWLPRSLSLALARFIGGLVYTFLGRYRIKTLEHLKSAYGESKTDEELQRIAKQVFINLAMNGVDWCKWPNLPEEKRDELISADPADVENLKSLFREGSGVVILSAHFGNWEILGSYLGEVFAPLRVVGRRIYYEPFNRVIVNLRKSWGVETIFADNSPRELLMILKRKQFLGMLIDQDVDSIDGVFAPFFGRLARTPSSPFRLAISKKATVFMAFLVREGMGYRFILKDIFRMEDKGSYDETVVYYTQLCTKIYEQIIRQYPEQWVWMHNRWKTRPTGETVNLEQKDFAKEAQSA